MNRAQQLIKVAGVKQMATRLKANHIADLAAGKYSYYDEVTSAHTAFETFEELLNAKGDYRPSIKLQNLPPAGTKRVELEFLAQLYDKAQELRGDPRRAYVTF